MNTAKKINHADADDLIMSGDRIHVVELKSDGTQVTHLWQRTKCMEQIAHTGAFLSGPAARSAHHGVCTRPDASTWLFFETGHK